MARNTFIKRLGAVSANGVWRDRNLQDIPTPQRQTKQRISRETEYPSTDAVYLIGVDLLC